MGSNGDNFALAAAVSSVIMVMMFGVARLDISERMQNDDGSSARHLSTSCAIGFLSSAVIPLSGEFIAVRLGEVYEYRHKGVDASYDMHYNRVGAHIGSSYGSIAGVFTWFMMLLAFGANKGSRIRRRRHRKYYRKGK